jgi:hypothetical protein
MSPAEQANIMRRRLAAIVGFYESDVLRAIGCRPEEISKIGQIQKAVGIADCGEQPKIVQQTAMHYVEAAAKSQHPEVAAAALAYLMAI